MCLYYKDIIDSKRLRRTFAKPVGIRRGGLADCDGLVLLNRCSEVWIPHYLLVGASLAWFNTFKAQEIEKGESNG